LPVWREGGEREEREREERERRVSISKTLKRTIATPMMPIPRNSTLVLPGAATGGGDDDEAAAAAAAATEEEEALVVDDLEPKKHRGGSRPSFRELCARIRGLISIKQEECSVSSEAWQRVDEERKRGDVGRAAVARLVGGVDVDLLDLEAAAGGAGEERSMVFSGGRHSRVSWLREEFRCCVFVLAVLAGPLSPRRGDAVGKQATTEERKREREEWRQKKPRSLFLLFLERSSASHALPTCFLTFLSQKKKNFHSSCLKKPVRFRNPVRCVSLLFLCVSQVRSHSSPSMRTKIRSRYELRGRRTKARF
jgi:hypothetical protein